MTRDVPRCASLCVRPRAALSNYGSPFSASIDMACGTFREALGMSKHYSGEWSEATVRSAKVHESTLGPKKVWSRHSYLGLPASATEAVYTLFWASLVPLLYWAAIANHELLAVTSVATSADGEQTIASRPFGRIGAWVRSATLRGGGGSGAGGGSAGGGGLLIGSLVGIPTEVAVAVAVAYLPIALAMLLAWVSGDRMSWRWPFHKEKLVGTLGLFLGLGWLACVLPTYHAVRLISEPVA